MQIAIVSDTHLPKGNRRLPESCVQRLRTADLIIHAGDFTELSVLRELESFGPMAAVRGNVDDAQIRSMLPAVAVVEAEGVVIAVVHDSGPARARLERMRRRFAEAHAVVFGHSHLPLHEEASGGFQIFNPGSPTERRRASWPSMGLAEAQDGTY